MNNMKDKQKLKVYYDGLCKVCSKEIGHYKKQSGSEHIEFIDICSAQFNADLEGLDPVQVHKVMHARREDGTIATRVDAFIEIWKVLPKYHRLAKLASMSFIKLGLEVGYSGFASIRTYLPRDSSSEDCKDSPYCELKNNEVIFIKSWRTE